MKKQHRSPIVEQWVEKAENDLRNATIVVKEPDPPTDTVCFHCHQTAEKYFKAFLTANAVSFRKVHDLRYLLNLCISKEPSFECLDNAVSVLNRYYIEARYPLDMPVRYPVEEAQKAADLAYEVREFVRNLLR